MNIDKLKLLVCIREECKKDPALVSEIIEAVTVGVKEFASKQKDHGSKIAFAMTAVIDSTTQSAFGPFLRRELVDLTSPWLDGTNWFKEQTEL